eukprot:13599996-Alexandrium_andersonii.AAC.1
MAPLRRLEATAELHAPRCGDAGRLAAARSAAAARALTARNRSRRGAVEAPAHAQPPTRRAGRGPVEGGRAARGRTRA